MNRKLVMYASLASLVALTSVLGRELHAQGGAPGTVGFCKLVSQLDKYRENPVTVRVKVKLYRHGTLISDPVCPKQSLALIADQAALQSNSLSHFYRFLAEHRHTRKPIFATITGRLVNGEGDDFALKRKIVFKLESVSEVAEGGSPNKS